jgi:hypothetical protein
MDAASRPTPTVPTVAGTTSMSQCSVNTTLGPGTLQESFGVTV